MSSYLLDTHVVLWWLSDPTQIAAGARNAILDPSSQLLVSTAAIWEMAIKRTLGKLEYPDNLIRVLNDEQIIILPIEARHALSITELPLLHHDAFDRVQVAQAKIERLTVITRDKKIMQYDVSVLTA